MPPLSLSPLTVHPCSPLELIDAASTAGFERVGLRVFPVLASDVDIMADAGLQRQVTARIGSSGLQVLDVEVVRLTPDMDIAAVEPALEFAAGVGAHWLAVTSVELSAYSSSDEPEIVDRLAALAELTSTYGMRVMLEFMAFRGMQTLQDAVRVVAATSSSHIGITVDALHFFRSGGRVTDLEAVEPSLLGCLQLCDGPELAPEDLVAESRYGRLYPGLGGLPLEALLAATSPSLPVAVEAPSAAHAHLPPSERAQEAIRCTRELMALVERLPTPRLSATRDLKMQDQADAATLRFPRVTERPRILRQRQCWPRARVDRQGRLCTRGAMEWVGATVLLHWSAMCSSPVRYS